MARLNDLIGQIPGSFGPGQGAFQSSSGNRIDLTPQGWQDSGTGELIAPTSQGGQQAISYSNPIDVMGRKGYLQPDGYVIGNNGEVVAEPAGTADARNRQIQAARKDEEYQSKRARALADLEYVKAQTAKLGAEPREARPRAEWKYDAGSDSWVAPPDEQNPVGRMTQSPAKLNAEKSLNYVLGEMEKEGPQAMQGGPMGIKGYLGKAFDSQNTRRFDNLKEQLSTELRTIFRIPGEGALSDKEQAQYGMQLPDVRNDEATNAAIVKDIKNRARIRMGGQPDSPASPSGGDGGLPPGWKVQVK